MLYQPDWDILVKLGEINMTPFIILSKTQSFITGENVSYFIYKYMINIYFISGVYSNPSDYGSEKDMSLLDIMHQDDVVYYSVR